MIKTIASISEGISIQLEKYNLMELEKDKVIFSHIAEMYLSEIIKYKSNKLGIQYSLEDLRQVYPFLFEDSMCRKYPVSILDNRIQITVDDNKDVLGCIYEDNLPVDIKKAMGQYYTRSNNIVIQMLDLLGYNGTEIIGKTILDPACGSGLFLVEVINRIKNNITGSDAAKIIDLVWDSVYGIDIDEFACYICELNIVLSMIEEIMIASKKNKSLKLKKLKIICEDFISINEEFKQVELFAPEIEEVSRTSKVVFPKTFDYIVSNPPYVTLYGRRSKNMNEAKREYYNQKFDFVMNKNGNNKFNTVMFFIENAIKLIKEGEKICFIIDISFFETAYKDIRKYILENCYVLSITTGISEFEGVASGQLIILIQRKKKIDDISNGQVKWIDNEKRNVFIINQNSWYNETNEYKFERPLQDKSKEICDKISVHPKLGDIFEKKYLRTCCALTGRSDDFMVSKEEFLNDKSDLVFPYLEGGKAFRNKFGALTPTNYFKYDYDLQQKISEEFKLELEKIGVKNKKRIALGDVESYRKPKIFIRQSATSLITTFTTNKYAANNSLYILSNQIDTSENIEYLKYICAILNSDLLTFYARQKGIIRMAVGKTPQIKLADLKKLPIVVVDLFQQNQVATIVDELLDNSGYDKKLLNKLNEIIYNMYAISEEESNYINKSLAE